MRVGSKMVFYSYLVVNYYTKYTWFLQNQKYNGLERATTQPSDIGVYRKTEIGGVVVGYTTLMLKTIIRHGTSQQT